MSHKSTNPLPRPQAPICITHTSHADAPPPSLSALHDPAFASTRLLSPHVHLTPLFLLAPQSSRFQAYAPNPYPQNVSTHSLPTPPFSLLLPPIPNTDRTKMVLPAKPLPAARTTDRPLGSHRADRTLAHPQRRASLRPLCSHRGSVRAGSGRGGQWGGTREDGRGLSLRGGGGWRWEMGRE